MKKITLIMSVILIWGCSQASEQAEVKEQVKAEVNAVKETVNSEVKEVTEEVAAKVSDVTQAQAEFLPGVHYQVINPAWDTQSEDQVVVYEFFGYLCPHCASFEPFMTKLKKDLPEQAKLVRVPVVFYPQWRPYAQAYYTFEAMDLVDKAHNAFFTAIHQHKKQFRSIEEIAEWTASSFNVDKAQFLSTAKSFMIDGQIRKGMQMMQAMGVSSTPSLITNGKYRPNSKALKSRGEVIEVTEYLVNLEVENMGLNK